MITIHHQALAEVRYRASHGRIAHRCLTLATLLITMTGVVDILQAQQGGSIAWRLQVNSPNPYRFRSGIAADGTVYLSGDTEIIAVSPAGQVQWTFPAAGNKGPIAVAADGTIYAAGFSNGGSSIRALNPDGTQQWVFTTFETQGIIAGPNIGPDGNIYAVVDTVPNGIGVFSLDPAGNVRWSSSGSPAVHQNGGGGREIAFGADRLYVTFKAGQGITPAALWSFRLQDGNQLFYLDSGCDSVPTANINSDVVVARGACGVTTYLPDGSVNWFTPTPPGVNTDILLSPVTGPDGTIYTAHTFFRFWALNMDGTTKWYINDAATHGFMQNLNVSPDNGAVIDLGVPDAGQPGWIKAYSTIDGAPMWQINLPVDPQGNLMASSPIAFTPDGTRGYFYAQVLGGNQYGFFYAIDVQQQLDIPGDINGDGVTDMNDIPVFAGVLVGMDTDPNHMAAADMNTDGAANGQDTQPFVNALVGG